MFRLHETTRRTLCRLAFTAGCFVPTCGVLAWAGLVRLPQYRALHEQAFGDLLGLKVSVTRVSLPRPGMTVYEGVELADAETGRPVARARRVEIGRSGAILVVVAVEPELDGRRLDLFVRALDIWTRRVGVEKEKTLRLASQEASVYCAGDAFTLADVRGQFEATEAGPQATFSFRMAGSAAGEAIGVRMTRNRQAAPPTTRWELDTGGARLPCGLLSAAWPPAARLGPRGMLRGAVSYGSDADHSAGQLTCEVTELDLNELVSQQFPHKLTGQGTLTIQSASFQHGRLEEATGWLRAGPGTVSSSLLGAAALCLHCDTAVARRNGSVTPYQQLAVSFRIDPSGLQVRGQCPAPAAGAMLVGESGVLVKEPTGGQPVANLVRMLAGIGPAVPATRQAEMLMHVLPLPAVGAWKPPASESESRLRDEAGAAR